LYENYYDLFIIFLLPRTYIFYNQISSIHAELDALPVLRYLNLSDNKLESVHASLWTVANRKMDLIGNHVTSVPKDLVAIQKIKLYI
jgi:Leucine-rich repeat (LRR) protein